MTSVTLHVLRKRADFLRLNRGRRFSAPGLVLQTAQTPDAPGDTTSVRVGLTVTKKIGNAVVRNKNRRRLREAARQVLPLAGRAGHDYVLIARQTTSNRSFEELKSDLRRGLEMVHKAKKPKPAKPMNSGEGVK